MSKTPRSELETRTQQLQTQLAANHLDGALIVQNADLFYFAGTIQQSQLYIPREGQPLLMTRRSFQRAQAESNLAHIVSLGSLREIPNLLQEHGYRLPQRLGLELDVLPTNAYLGYQELFSTTELTDVSLAIRRVRAVKSAYELGLLRRAANIAEPTFQALPQFLIAGISEIELAGKVEAVARGLGHQGIVKFRLWNNELFYGHLMAGKGAAQRSYLSSPTGGRGPNPAVAQGSSRHRIRRGEPVLFDYTFATDGYIVDQARIFSIGTLPDKLVRAHQVMLEIQAAIAATAKPGVTGAEIYQLALRLAQRHGYADHFMGADKERVTFVGHGVGIELDEFPFLAKGQDMPLEAGMTIAVEPKVSFATLGTVGIENTFVVTARGAKQLTRGSDDIYVVI
ncbi:MAG TPA: Xaa-Pro peptidase family protein [Candidatus Competibacteraceae bacterium]|nr:Xaa-Pro peptidase family protein [Candidatus Competibacteraceae bacterium]